VRRFYYDTAGSANPIAMQGLKQLLGGTSHIVFGTSAQIGQAMGTVGVTAAELRGVDRETALTLLAKGRIV
jgi:hypothetical protein